MSQEFDKKTDSSLFFDDFKGIEIKSKKKAMT
jgi:hypothetical protein